MLIEFSVGNFASFKETITLSLVAAKIRSINKRLDSDNIIPIDQELGLLRSAAVYGANASGKSNLVAAASFMSRFVRESFEKPFDAGVPVDRFRLSTDTDDQPSHFEMVFLLDGHQYRYGFDVDAQQVAAEWLYYVPKKREILLFERTGQEIIPNTSNPQAGEFRAIPKQLVKVNPNQPLRPNALFLSVAAQNQGPMAQQILTWFGNMRFMSGLNDSGFRHFTVNMFEKPESRARIIELVRSLDVDIDDIGIQRREGEKVLEEAPEYMRAVLEKLHIADFVQITTQHRKMNPSGDVVGYEIFDMGIHESAGTEKLFFMTGPIIDTLTYGRVLWVDEMEARLHPNMTEAIVALFNSPITNPKGAQIIFTTHDTNLLNIKKLRRDQIWFVEKNRQAASQLYSLVEFKIRNDDASLEQDYIRGRYGAVPHIDELSAAYEVETR
jgi:AAA15 family ATPase/GTPase